MEKKNDQRQIDKRSKRKRGIFTEDDLESQIEREVEREEKERGGLWKMKQIWK